MLNISRLISREASSANNNETDTLLKTDKQRPSPRAYRSLLEDCRDKFLERKKPVVVWNVTYRCNLSCKHCYSASRDVYYPGELTTEEGLSLVRDISDYGVPAIVFSGGEPLLRDDLYALVEEASQKGINCALSSNGVLITKETAENLKGAGFYYVGVSIDGARETNDAFRGRNGAFDDALEGVRNCIEAGLKVGLRLTLSRRTVKDLPFIFDLAEREGVHRLYLSHLVYAGRGRLLSGEALQADEIRDAVDYIFARTEEFLKMGFKIEVVTGNNDADGIYLYYRVLRTNPLLAERIYGFLKKRGGNSSGVSIACIDSFGGIHPDQYWTKYTIGNVRERPFSYLWEDEEVSPLLRDLRDRKRLLKGRCRWCRHIDVCAGNYRVRALAFTGDVWGDDPSCYLSDEEVGIYERHEDERRVSYI